ncbi:malic enzyme, NAD binding domain protein [Cooperia oncophora]
MVKPTALLGISTVGGAFTPEIIREMANINARPIIFALSNPTIKSECTAEDAYKHTNGTVLFASGSPFDNVELNGKVYKPGQGNNSYIFPGVALGAILFKAKHIPEKAFLIAARRVAASVTEKSLNEYSRLYPRLKDIRELSVNIALDIGNHLYENNLATLHPEPEDKEMFIRQQVYNYNYEPSINDLYSWPEKDARHGFPVPVLPRISMDDEP